jgi:hypothetical protein
VCKLQRDLIATCGAASALLLRHRELNWMISLQTTFEATHVHCEFQFPESMTRRLLLNKSQCGPK